MKNNTYYILTLSVGTLVFAYFLPWWCIAVYTAFISFLYKHSIVKSIVFSFVTVGLLFTITAMFMNLSSDSRIAEMMSEIFKNVGVTNLYYISGLIGGLTAALGSWTGSALRETLEKQTKTITTIK